MRRGGKGGEGKRLNLTLKTEAHMGTGAMATTPTPNPPKKGNQESRAFIIIIIIRFVITEKYLLPCDPPCHPPSEASGPFIQFWLWSLQPGRKGPPSPSPTSWLFLVVHFICQPESGFSILLWPVSQRDIFLVLI